MAGIGGEQRRAIRRQLNEIGEDDARQHRISQRVGLEAGQCEPQERHVGRRPRIQNDVAVPELPVAVVLHPIGDDVDDASRAARRGFLERQLRKPGLKSRKVAGRRRHEQWRRLPDGIHAPLCDERLPRFPIERAVSRIPQHDAEQLARARREPRPLQVDADATAQPDASLQARRRLPLPTERRDGIDHARRVRARRCGNVDGDRLAATCEVQIGVEVVAIPGRGHCRVSNDVMAGVV